MNRSLIAQFILRLQDRTSAGLGAIQRRLQGLAQVARRISLLGGLGAGLAVAGPIAQSAALEGQMRQTAITAGLSGAAVEEQMRSSRALFQRVARETNVRVRDLAGAAGTLVAGGGRAGEVWEQLVPIIGRVSSASGAGATDLASTALSMVNNLGLGPEQIEQAFASLVQAGKEGQFELRDMAREFAGLTAAAAGMGLRGPEAVNSIAAALQVARRGAGSAAEAATNLGEIFGKMASPETIRNFREMGVDLEGVLKNAAERGINPLEALIQKLRERTGGDMFRVGELFADKQALQFLRPMLQQTAEYIQMRDRAAATSPALIQTDSESAMRGLAGAIQRATIAWEEISVRMWDAAEGPIRMAGDMIFWLSRQLGSVENAFPGLVGQIGFGVAALTAGAAAISALGFLLGPLGAGLALLMSPIGLVIAGVVALGVAAWQLWRNWEPIAAFFTGLWNDLRAGMQPQVDWLLDVLEGAGAIAVGLFRAAWDGLGGFFMGVVATIIAPFTGLGGAFAAAWTAASAPFQAFGAWVSSWAAGPVAALSSAILAPFAGLGSAFAAAWDMAGAPFEAFGAWLSSWAAGPLAALASAILAPFAGLGSAFAAAWAMASAPFEGFGAWLSGWAAGPVAALASAILTPFAGLGGAFAAAWAMAAAPFEAFGAWVSGWAAGPVAALVSSIMAPFAGLTGWFASLWSTMSAPFDAFIGTITAGLDRVRAVWDGMRGAFSSGQAAQVTLNAAPPAMGGVQARAAAARANPAGGFYPANDLAAATGGGAGGAPAQPVNGEIVVRAAPGTEIVSAEGSNSNVPVTAAAQNRGATRGRP